MKIMKKNYLKYLGVFFLFFAIFFGWHAMHTGLLGTDDPYYHAKHSYLMAASGNFTLVEPWVPFHFLTTAPADLWWLYHVIVAVFIKFCGIIWGAKIWSAVCAASVFAVFYFILKQLKVFYPFVWTWLLFISSATFTVRLLFERPFVLSIALIPLCFYFIYQRKYWLLFFTSIIYTLVYELAPIILLLVVVFLAVDWCLTKEINLRPLIFFLGGLTVGIIIHPQALHYMYAMYEVLWRTGWFVISGVNLNTGAEIQLHSFRYFLESNIIIFLFYIISVALFAEMFLIKKSSRLQFSLFLVSFIWFLVAIAIPRGTEYWLPLGCLFVAVTFYQVACSSDWTIARQFMQTRIKASLVLFFIYGVILVFASYNMFAVFTVLRERNQNDADIYYQEANDWLIKNTSQNSVVFYPVWSMWPQMFFYNSHNRYLTAFGPEFLYEYNHEIYYIWANISYHGVYCQHEWPCLELSPRQEMEAVKLGLKNILDSKIVVVPNIKNTSLYGILDEFKEDYEKVYENKELVIFSIIP